MRIVVHGQQAFGKGVLEALLERGENVVGAFCAPDKEGRPEDPLKTLALEKGLTLHQPVSWKTDEAAELMQSFDADAASWPTSRFRAAEGARHPAPRHLPVPPVPAAAAPRPSSINWPIIMGSTKSGYSWFYPTDGLDEGDSLLQWECDIAPDDTVIDLYFKKIYPSAIESVTEVCDLFRSGEPPHIVPDEASATYERRCTKKHAGIDWNKPVKQAYDLIRGTNPTRAHGQREWRRGADLRLQIGGR